MTAPIYQRFDYQVVIIEHQCSQAVLNRYGADGWELVDFEIERRSPVPGVAVQYPAFKRPVPIGAVPDNGRSPFTRVSGL